MLLVAELQNIFHWLYSWQSIRYSMLMFGLCKILGKRCLSHYQSINSCQSNKASLTTCGEPCLLQWDTCTKLRLQVNSLLLSKLQVCCSFLKNSKQYRIISVRTILIPSRIQNQTINVFFQVINWKTWFSLK